MKRKITTWKEIINKLLISLSPIFGTKLSNLSSLWAKDEYKTLVWVYRLHSWPNICILLNLSNDTEMTGPWDLFHHKTTISIWPILTQTIVVVHAWSTSHEIYNVEIAYWRQLKRHKMMYVCVWISLLGDFGQVNSPFPSYNMGVKGDCTSSARVLQRNAIMLL